MAWDIQPAATAPKDGTTILMWWPLVQLDEDGNLTDKPVEGDQKGAWVPTQWDGSTWDEPDWFEAIGEYFGDDYSYAADPTHWTLLPPGPAGAP